MNHHLITLARHLESRAGTQSSSVAWGDRSWSIEKNQIYRDRQELLFRASELRKAARTPEEAAADERIELQVKEERRLASIERDRAYNARLDEIFCNAVFPRFLKDKANGESLKHMRIVYRHHLPQLEQMFSNMQQVAA